MNKNYNKFDIERIREIPMSCVVEQYSKIKRSGATYRSLCPWHDDHNPSLVLYDKPGNNHCHCYACNKGGSSIDYVMQHENVGFADACQILSRAFNIPSIGSEAFVPRSVCKSQPPKENAKQATYIPTAIVEDMVSDSNSLSRCLSRLFSGVEVAWVTDMYKLGIYEKYPYSDFTAFPSIDSRGYVHNIKIQRYETDFNSSNFCHCDKKEIWWLGAFFVKEGLLPVDSIFDNDCLFGGHLLPQYPQANVVLVESPKNAVIGALLDKQRLWVATGSMNMLKPSVIQSLRGRNVTVIPDNEAYAEWTEQIAKMQHIANFVIADTCQADDEELGPKYDIGDCIVRWRKNLARGIE